MNHQDNAVTTSSIQTAAFLNPYMAPYKAVLCDLWGVVHDGLRVHDGAVRCLQGMRAQGITVILLSNAPRASHTVAAQLTDLGLPDGCYDDIVTSGDMVTRWLLAAQPRPVCYHLGQDWGESIFEGGLVPQTTDIDAADMIVCSALPFNEDSLDNPFYDELFGKALARHLPFLCANPDLSVHKGDTEVYCAGALAAVYAKRGGHVDYIGKPYPLIYQHCLSLIADLRQEQITAQQVLAIGDGLRTDIRGANGAGLGSVLITSGLHRDQLGVNGDSRVLPSADRLNAAFTQMQARPDLVMTYLDWS